MKINKLLVLAVLFFTACNQDPSINEKDKGSEVKSTKPIEYFGNTQGTTYAIICNDEVSISHQEVEETLHHFDLALSSYIPNSILSKLNSAGAGTFEYVDSFNYFNSCLALSRTVFDLSKGNFDPTVYPLVDGWGFMKEIENVPDSLTIDSLRMLVGFQNGNHFNFYPSKSDSTLELSKIVKNTANAKLDFNALAQGLSVDVICELLESKGAKNYFVEIGGEIRVKGKNSEDNIWTIGIDKPIENSTAVNRELQEIIQLDNKAVATSGSYRKFYEKNGVKYSHTLDPKTGYPVTHSLLSATVVAPNCASADGLATAFMVMGPNKSIKFIKSGELKNIEVYLIFYNSKGRIETYLTKGFKDLIY
jgi:thiamine biosynthesis lipoprotein